MSQSVPASPAASAFARPDASARSGPPGAPSAGGGDLFAELFAALGAATPPQAAAAETSGATGASAPTPGTKDAAPAISIAAWLSASVGQSQAEPQPTAQGAAQPALEDFLSVDIALDLDLQESVPDTASVALDVQAAPPPAVAPTAATPPTPAPDASIASAQAAASEVPVPGAATSLPSVAAAAAAQAVAQVGSKPADQAAAPSLSGEVALTAALVQRAGQAGGAGSDVSGSAVDPSPPATGTPTPQPPLGAPPAPTSADAAVQPAARVRGEASASAPDAKTALSDALAFAIAHDAGAQARPDAAPGAQQPATPPVAGAFSVHAAGAIVPADPTAAVHASAAHVSGAAAVPIEGLAVEIAARARERKRRFEIRLDPPELGRIDVRLDVARDGQVTSRLVVERAETLDLLRRDAASLERALHSAGLRTDDSGLQFSLRDQSGGRWAGQDDTPRASVLIVPDEDVAVREAVRRGYGALRGLGRGVDIKI